MPTCAVCGADDYLTSPDVHFVQIDLVYIDNADELTPKLKRAGWDFKIFQGRPCRYRFTCVECMRAVEESKHAWQEIDDERRDADSNKTDLSDFYQPLCN
jgi:hypothetical protein